MSDLIANLNGALPFLSLFVALLAVFVGPFLSWYVAKQQINTSLVVANKQIVAPMRQSWIDSLRDMLADLLATAAHYQGVGFENRSDQEYLHLNVLELKIGLMLNFNEEDHQKLFAYLQEMRKGLTLGAKGDRQFIDSHTAATEQARKILKTEWNRVREDMPALR